MPRGGAASVSAAHWHASGACCDARRVSCDVVVAVVCIVDGKACARIGVACGSRTRTRRSHRHGTTVTRMHCPHRHSIATARFRHDLDQRMCVSAIHDVHGTAGGAAWNRSFVHRASCGCRCRIGTRSRMPIPGHRLSADTGSQSNDRFKRRAGYLGTAVSSKTRSGRRWWPGQYVLPYIRWTGPNSASLMGGGASKPFSITM